MAFFLDQAIGVVKGPFPIHDAVADIAVKFLLVHIFEKRICKAGIGETLPTHIHFTLVIV